MLTFITRRVFIWCKAFGINGDVEALSIDWQWLVGDAIECYAILGWIGYGSDGNCTRRGECELAYSCNDNGVDDTHNLYAKVRLQREH